MIYLIGGAPRVGKSLVAKALAEKIGATFVSTDDLCRAAIKCLPPDQKLKKFPFRGFSGNPSKNTVDVQKNVGRQMTSAKSLTPEIDRVVSDAIGAKTALIIEGVHILPEYAEQLHKKYGHENVQVVFVGSKDAERIMEGIAKDSNPDSWMRGSDPKVIKSVAEFAAAFSERIQNEAQSYGQTYVERTEEFEADLKKLCGMLLYNSETRLPLK